MEGGTRERVSEAEEVVSRGYVSKFIDRLVLPTEWAVSLLRTFVSGCCEYGRLLGSWEWSLVVVVVKPRFNCGYEGACGLSGLRGCAERAADRRAVGVARRRIRGTMAVMRERWTTTFVVMAKSMES